MSKLSYWNNQLNKIKEPPKDKQVWYPHDEPHKLAVVLIEFRKHNLIGPVLRNNAHIYGGTDVSLVIMHGKKNKEYIENQIKGWSNVHYIELPYDNIDRFEYSTVLTKPSFWRNFKSEYTLIIQTDTVTLRKIPNNLYNYSYVGAPWPKLKPKRSHSRIGNGGYSLRKVKDMIKICEEHPFDRSKDNAEDVFFSKYLPLNKLPTAATAKTFAVECCPFPTPCGSHQGWKFGTNFDQLKVMLQPQKRFH